jgi:IS605 OrfB family transposase
MTSQTLSQSLELPENQKVKNLIEQAHRISQTFLDNYYSEELLETYQKWSEENNYNSYKFFSQVDEYNPFENEEDYYYNRFKRCIYQNITNQLDNHSSKKQAFDYIKENTNGRINSQDKQELREQLFEQEKYINYSQYKILLDEFENYYKEHGEQPEDYIELNKIRKIPYTLPLAPDDNQIHQVETNSENLHFTLKTPCCDKPDSYHDYQEDNLKVKIPNHLEKLLQAGEICKPSLRLSDNKLYLDIPVKMKSLSSDSISSRVLACDLGVSTQVTSSIIEEQGEEIRQLSQPEFYNHDCKRKLQRIIEERTQTPNNTREYNALTEKEKNLRNQIQHDIANHLVSKALTNKCETIVMENLSDLQAPSGMARTSRHISHWARGDLLEKIEYKANLVGLNVETVNPWKTSQYCSKCGEHGHTIKASNNHKEVSHGGWFHCPSCGFSGDRDYNASLNVGRVYLSQEDRIVQCKPVEYTSTGNHAGFPSEAFQGSGDRFTSVQPNHQPSESKVVDAKGCKTPFSMSNRNSPIQLLVKHTK